MGSAPVPSEPCAAGVAATRRAPHRRWPWVLGGLVAVLLALVALALGILAARRTAASRPPPRATAAAPIPAAPSTIAVPLVADLASLQRLLDAQLPQTLWTIDQGGVKCAGPLKCHVVGAAVRGPITLHGAGRDIVADIPVRAEVHARHIVGVVGATARGEAMLHARIRLAVARDWRVRGTVRLAYDWQTPPTIAILGAHIRFTDKADAKLRPVMAKLERTLPATLDRLDLPAKIAGLWAHAFTVFSLNAANPPVWMRVVPQRMAFGGYTVADGRLRLDLALTALTQVTVGPRPPPPPPTALPAMAAMPMTGPGGEVRAFVPVVADYREIVPVIAKALAKRETYPFDLPGTGAIMVHFANVQAWGAPGGRIAVGADVATWPATGAGATRWMGATRGHIWFVARPQNAADSQRVHFTDLDVRGGTDGLHGNLLLALAGSPGFSDVVADALTQNFARDFAKLRGKIAHALADKRVGAFVITARVAQVHNGALAAWGNGLYLPVWMAGPAQLAFAPGAAGDRFAAPPGTVPSARH